MHEYLNLASISSWAALWSRLQAALALSRFERGVDVIRILGRCGLPLRGW